MRCYVIQDHQIAACSHRPDSVPAHAILIKSPKDFDQSQFTLSRLAGLWNALPGVDPVKRFQSRQTAVNRLWAAMTSLPVPLPGKEGKQVQMIALLRRPSGATIDDLMGVATWQRHSVRGFLSGVLRKKMGLTVSSTLVGEDRIYRITP